MQKINLNLIPGGVRPVINVSQYDEGRQFQLAIFNGSASYDLTGKTVVIEVGKLDGNGVAYDDTDEVNNIPVVAISGNIVTITTPKQMTAVAGQNNAELKISDSSAVVGTLNFILDCEQSALSPDTPISDTQIPALEDLASQNAQKALDAVSHYPYIDNTTKNWFVWDVDTGAFVDTGVRAQGIDGQGGVASVNSVLPDIDGNVALLLASSFSDILPTARGGTGNGDGYIRTGQKSGTTIGTNATIEGSNNEASGSHSRATGYNTAAKSYAAVAEGSGTVADGIYSHAAGLGTRAGYEALFAVGKYNVSSSNSLFVVGNGTADNARSNAIEVRNDGRIYKGTSDAFPAASNLAPVEMTRTMSTLRAANSYLYVAIDDQFYQVGSSDIPANGTLTPGTNATAKSVAEVLSALNSDLTPQAYTLTPATNITINRQSVYRIGKFVMGTVLFKSSVANPTNLLYLAHIADGRMDLPYYNLDTYNMRGIATISAGYSGIFRNTGAIDANADYCINIMAVLR